MTTKKQASAALDEFHYHEAMDRTGVALNHWTESVTQHPVAVKHKKLRRACERVEAAMAKAYTIAASLTKLTKNGGAA